MTSRKRKMRRCASALYPPLSPAVPRFVECPTCGKSFGSAFIDGHAWECGAMSELLPREQDKTISFDSTHEARLKGKSRERKRAVREGFITCPSCSESFHQQVVAKHAWECGSGQGKPAGTASTGNNDLRPGASREWDSARNAHAVGNPSETMDVPLKHKRTSTQGTSAHVATSAITDEDSRSGGAADDVALRLMEAGRRMAKAEREAKKLPRSWPVELIEDILPERVADELLASLLRVSRVWTSHPWYSNSGIEGRSHSRSHVFRFPRTATHNAGECRSRQESGCRVSSESLDAAEDLATCKDRGRIDGVAAACSSQEVQDDHEDCTADTARNRDVPASSRTRKPFHAGTPSSDVSRMLRSSKDDERDRRSTYEELIAGEGSDEAPEILVKILPHVVEVVRRRQQERINEGLGGEEGLGWNPNYCICHVYDDHRSNIGAHTDTLSNIGPQAIVVGISLGAKRVFMVQKALPWDHRRTSAGDNLTSQTKYIDMPHNSAVVMWGGCQERFKHGVPALPKGVGMHSMAGTKRISITLRERKEHLPSSLLPVPDCRCRAPATLKARVLTSGRVEYFYQCDRGQGQCGFMLSKCLAK